MVKSSGRAKIGGVLDRLCGYVVITETSLMELGIPPKAIRDSEPSIAIVWIDARRLRRHMRKYNRFAERQRRAKLFSTVPWEWSRPAEHAAFEALRNATRRGPIRAGRK